MDMDVDSDKSEDELELERFVFGDADGIKQRLKGGKDVDPGVLKTDLEHLENDQVRAPYGCLRLTVAILRRFRGDKYRRRADVGR